MVGTISDGLMRPYSTNFLQKLLLLHALPFGVAIAQPVERDWSEDPKSKLVHCALFSKGSQYHQYENSNYAERPEAADLGNGEHFSEDKWLRINRYYCERFFSEDPRDRFITMRSGVHWYDKREFFHESELVSVDYWRTRYIYEKSDPSYVGSELMMPEEEIELDRLVGYNAYMLGDRMDNLYQFSDDGYYLDRKIQIRWRIKYLPEHSSEGNVYAADALKIFLIDESGRYLPQGLPAANSQQYRFNCERRSNGGVSCGYGPKNPAPIPIGVGEGGMRFNGVVRNISPEFTPLKIEADRITIARRLSHGEKFWLDDRQEVDVNNFFFYADFDDPIRPVYFAPGVLLRDRPKGYTRAPSEQDFIDKEVCLTDCPSDTEWQFSGIRKRIEAHP
ncbi:hypothetical protein [Stenotrophomonas sp. Iso1]|uniref:hypothetical protein n=1 Tax=Stenotrophomonas sp. Iso1 TaxID=2977283 RepID=UPI0022B7A93B|nr:hypothetical protein [Stenotrophomonas sp. Iso1]